MCRTSSTEKSPVGSDVMCCLNYSPQIAGGPCFFGQWWSVLLKPEVAKQAPARVCFGAHAARNYNILPSKFVCAYFNSTKPRTPKYTVYLGCSLFELGCLPVVFKKCCVFIRLTLYFSCVSASSSAQWTLAILFCLTLAGRMCESPALYKERDC